MDKPTRERQPAETRPAMRNAIVVMCCLPEITKSDLKVGMVILELTAGHGKLKDRISRSEIARRTGVSGKPVSEKTVTRALKKFAAAGIIEWSPAKAAGQLSMIRLRKAGEIMPNIPGLEHEVWLKRVQPTSELPPQTGPTRDKTQAAAGEEPTGRGTKLDEARDKTESYAGQNETERGTKCDGTRDKSCPTTTINTSLSTSLVPPLISASEVTERREGTPFKDAEESVEDAASRLGVSVHDFMVSAGLRPPDHVVEEIRREIANESLNGRGVPNGSNGSSSDLLAIFDKRFERMHADENGLFWTSRKRDHKNKPYRDDLFAVFSRIWREGGVSLGSGPEWLAESVIRRGVRLPNLDQYDHDEIIDSFIADSWRFEVSTLLHKLEAAYERPLNAEERSLAEAFAIDALTRGSDVCNVECQLDNPSLWQSGDPDLEDDLEPF